MTLLPTSKSLLATLAALVCICAALLGYRVGLGDQQPLLAGASTGSVDAEHYAAELDVLTRQRDVAKETLRELQVTLANVERLNDADRAELDLYRRIATDSTPSGLSIDDVTRDADSLAITLIQSRGRQAVNGVAEVALTRINGERVERLVLPSESGEDEIKFDFRFFETIILPVGAAAAFSPQHLEVTIRPNGTAYKEFKAEFAWEDVNR